MTKSTETLKGIGEDCVNFFDIDREISLGLVPYASLPALPRVGEKVNLPSGQYRIEDVQYYYREDRESNRPEQFCPTELYAIHIGVKRIADL